MKTTLLASALALFLATSSAPAAFAQTTTAATSTSATSTPANATTTPFKLGIMKHLCGQSIRNTSDLVGVAQGAGSDPVARFLAMEATCPTTALPGDEAATSSIAAQRMAFDFAVIGLGAANGSTTAATTTQFLTDADYVNRRICETEAGVDFDKNGTTSPETCLDGSHYEFNGFALGMASSTGTSSPSTASTTQALISIIETTPPSGYRFGALSFTPREIMQNDDLNSFVSLDSADRLIVLDVATDTDRTVMLHVFNFLTSTTSTSTGTTTPGTGTTTPGTGTTTPDGGDDEDEIGGSLRDRLELMRSRIESRMNELRSRLEELRQRLNG